MIDENWSEFMDQVIEDSLTNKPEAVDGYWCDDCDIFISGDEYDEQPSYECGSCGEQFLREDSYSGDNHQCPSCMKFASKLVDIACPECISGELREYQAYENSNGEWVEKL